jgi:hypothetical protein
MTRILALFFATSTTAALAQPSIETASAGNGNASIVVENLTPNGHFVVQIGEHLYPSEITAGPCAGTQNLIDTTDESYFRHVLRADASGGMKFTIPASAEPYGKEIQILDAATCTNSWPQTIGVDICNQPVALVETLGDLDALQECRQLGIVQAGPDLKGNVLDRLDLPNLEAVRTFDSTYSAAEFPELQLDALTFVGEFTATVSGSLDLPSLVHATKFALDGDASYIALDSLKTLGESMTVRHMPTLKYMYLPNLTEIGNGVAPFTHQPAGTTAVIIEGNDNLSAIHLGALQYADRLLVRENPSFCPDQTSATWPTWSNVFIENQVAVYNNMPGCDVTLIP